MVAKRKKRAKKKTKSVAKRKSTLPADWKKQLLADAAEESERTPAGVGNKIILKRNGQFSFQGADLGGSITCVIVDHVVVKKYFDTDYDEDNPSPPACFALKANEKNIAPHPDSPKIFASLESPKPVPKSTRGASWLRFPSLTQHTLKIGDVVTPEGKFFGFQFPKLSHCRVHHSALAA